MNVWPSVACAARVTAIVAAALAPAASAAAQVIVDAQGFEAPLFTTSYATTGQLEGQTPATVNGAWLRTGGAGASAATIQSAIVGSGGQAVRVDRAANSDVRWGVPVSGYPSGDAVRIAWDMRVERTVGPDGTFGPFFGVEAYDDDVTAIGLLASLGVDATTGDVLFQAPDTGFFTETGEIVAFGEWNSFTMDLDYATKRASYYLNANWLGTFGFVDENNIVGGLDEFTDADIATLAAAGDPESLALTGVAYFDNFLVVDGLVIPEPAALGLAATALVLLAARGRGVGR